MRLIVVVATAVGLITLATIALADKSKIKTTQSTVVYINSGNIILLLALKVVVVLVAFGLSGSSRGRSLSLSSQKTWLNHEDLMFLTAFALSNDLQGHGCVSRVACQYPTMARQLASAAAFLTPFEGAWLKEVWKAKYHLEKGFHTHLTLESCRQHNTCPQLPDL